MKNKKLDRRVMLAGISLLTIGWFLLIAGVLIAILTAASITLGGAIVAIGAAILIGFGIPFLAWTDATN